MAGVSRMMFRRGIFERCRSRQQGQEISVQLAEETFCCGTSAVATATASKREAIVILNESVMGKGVGVKKELHTTLGK